MKHRKFKYLASQLQSLALNLGHLVTEPVLVTSSLPAALIGKMDMTPLF